ncbi:MAG TPA: hypothetical protein VNO30_22170, partial [Kofleriaceae bacterium]|nr:hypothetical protein [Kofleriaceae bacterium]
MKRLVLCSVAALTAVLGCGDNSKVCGPGTDDLDGDGLCEAGAGSSAPPPMAMCSDGTILDPQTNSCVIDPSSCQDGTVLINGRCVDPTEGLIVDLSEGTEPNNAGVGGIEASPGFAGQIALAPQGKAFVVKGNVNPFRDDDSDGEIDPDMDAYQLTVAAPTLLEVSVDGVGGLMGAFMVVPTGANPAGQWRRFGLNVTGDTSKRQIYLPAAGTYAIAVTDTRALSIDGDSPPAAGAGAAAGSPKANYFMSITALPMPAPTALTVTGGVATSTGTLGVGDVALFTAPLGAGLNEIELDIPTTPMAAVVVDRNGAYKADAAEELDLLQGDVPARVTVAGFMDGDTALIVADTVYHYGPGAAPYTLTIRPGAAAALSRTGTAVSQPEVIGRYTAFYYDVAAPDEITAFALTWNQPVAGMIVDAELRRVASFTFDPTRDDFGDRTFTSYTGLVRHRAAGRHYFLVFDPASAGPTQITATSSIATLPTSAIVKGTPLTNQPASTTFRSRAYTYDAGAGATDQWQLFNAIGTGTGVITTAFFDPATAYGRLDSLVTAGTDPLASDADPIFTEGFPEAGAPQGRVMIGDPTASYLVTVRTPATTGAPTFTLDFKSRTHNDLGTLATGQGASLMTQQLTATSPQRFYLVRAAPGTKLTITLDPITTTLDTRLRLLSRDEDVLRTYNNAPAGADDIAQFLQDGSGWTAFAVLAATPPTGTVSFNLTINVATFTAPTYARTAGTTAYFDACLGGTLQPLTSDGTGTATNEGLTQPIATPTGFTFFGLLEPQLTASTNGWLSFGPVSAARPGNANLPTAGEPDALVAPYWDDLAGITICTKTVNSRLVVQWTGRLAGGGPTIAVETQAIL